MQPTDWRIEHRYDVLMSHPEAQARIEQAASRGRKLRSAREFLDRAQQAQDLWDLLGGSLGGVEKKVSSVLSTALGTALGFEINKMQTTPYPQPVGVVLVGISCALAQCGFRLTQALQGSDGCVLQAWLPRNWATKEGSVICAVTGYAWQAQVQSAVKVPGQLYDWGRGNRVLTNVTRRTRAWVAAG